MRARRPVTEPLQVEQLFACGDPTIALRLFLVDEIEAPAPAPHKGPGDTGAARSSVKRLLTGETGPCYGPVINNKGPGDA